jgi:hypothetical protein
LIRDILNKPVSAKAAPAKAVAPAKAAAPATSGLTAVAVPGATPAASASPSGPASSRAVPPVNAGEPPSPAKTPAVTPEQATAAFIADLSASLAELARAQRFDALAYLFDLAALESQSLAAAPSAPPRECQQAISR